MKDYSVDVKNSQVVIKMPDDCMIDAKNTDFEKGIIRFKHKYITFNDVKNQCSEAGAFYTKIDTRCIYNGNVSFKKMLATAKLYDIARYYNRDKKREGINGTYFICIGPFGGFTVREAQSLFNFAPMFIDEKDAIDVIENPNFRSILHDVLLNVD